LRGARAARLGVALGTCATCGALAVAACVDFSSLQTPDPAPDGGGPSDASFPSDAPPEAEASTPPDAAVDAGADGRWCTTHPGHGFCADFDDVGNVEVGWTRSVVSGGPGGGAIALDRGQSKSSPASFKSSVVNGSTFGGTYAALVQSFPTHPASLTLAADVLAAVTGGDAIDAGSAGYLGLQDIAPSDAGDIFYGVGLGLTAGTAGLTVRVSYANAAGYTEFNTTTAPLPHDWTRVVVSLDFGPPEHLVITFDGTAQVDHVLTDSVPIPNANLNAVVGIVNVNASSLEAHYDNVTIDTK
jgi:hypothetical protein